MTSGERELVMELTPSDPAGVVTVQPVHLTPDAEGYVYSYKRLPDELYVLEGLK